MNVTSVNFSNSLKRTKISGSHDLIFLAKRIQNVFSGLLQCFHDIFIRIKSLFFFQRSLDCVDVKKPDQEFQNSLQGRVHVISPESTDESPNESSVSLPVAPSKDFETFEAPSSDTQAPENAAHPSDEPSSRESPLRNEETPSSTAPQSQGQGLFTHDKIKSAVSKILTPIKGAFHSTRASDKKLSVSDFLKKHSKFEDFYIPNFRPSFEDFFKSPLSGANHDPEAFSRWGSTCSKAFLAALWKSKEAIWSFESKINASNKSFSERSSTPSSTDGCSDNHNSPLTTDSNDIDTTKDAPSTFSEPSLVRSSCLEESVPSPQASINDTALTSPIEENPAELLTSPPDRLVQLVDDLRAAEDFKESSDNEELNEGSSEVEPKNHQFSIDLGKTTDSSASHMQYLLDSARPGRRAIDFVSPREEYDSGNGEASPRPLMPEYRLKWLEKYRERRVVDFDECSSAPLSARRHGYVESSVSSPRLHSSASLESAANDLPKAQMDSDPATVPISVVLEGLSNTHESPNQDAIARPKNSRLSAEKKIHTSEKKSAVSRIKSAVKAFLDKTGADQSKERSRQKLDQTDAEIRRRRIDKMMARNQSVSKSEHSEGSNVDLTQYHLVTDPNLKKMLKLVSTAIPFILIAGQTYVKNENYRKLVAMRQLESKPFR